MMSFVGGTAEQRRFQVAKRVLPFLHPPLDISYVNALPPPPKKKGKSGEKSEMKR